MVVLDVLGQVGSAGPQHARDLGPPDLDGVAGRDEREGVRCEGQRRVVRVCAVVYFLRKVIWTVPDFSVERYEPELRRLHALIERDGAFVCESTRRLIEARKPD